MVVRNAAAGFAGGAIVFPGGKVDPGDAELAEGRGTDRLAASRIAAIRETWEECGILLARERGSRDIVSGDRAARLTETGTPRSFAALLDAFSLLPASDLLVHFAHWITPLDQPRRFDTHFFIAPDPGTQTPRHDGREATDARWIAPQDALDAARAGQLKLVFATRMNLLRLTRYRSTREALDIAATSPPVVVTPELVETERGRAFRIPSEAGYGVCEVPLDGIPRA